MQPLIFPSSLSGYLKTPTSSKLCVSTISLDHQLASDLLKEEATKAGLVITQPWFSKVEQLYAMTQIKHGKYMCMAYGECMCVLYVHVCV